MVTKELYNEIIDHLTYRVENVKWCKALQPVTARDRAFLREVKKDLEKMAQYCDQILKAAEN